MEFDEFLKFVGGLFLFTFGVVYVVCGLFSPIAIMWMFFTL
tara:strand:- start:283 stop:405 length:123 start_codon:yes stop_codon:yes gene_type:complete